MKHQKKRTQTISEEKKKQKREAIYVTECTGKTINEGQLRELIKQDGGLRKLEIRKSAERREGNVGIAYFETKDQAAKTVETLNKSKRYVAKQYKINDENGPREQKQQSGTLTNHRKEEDQWRKHQREQAEAEKSSKRGANDGKKCHACDSSEHLIRTCTKQRNIVVTYKERREITARDMINIMEEYGTINRLKVQNKIHANNGKTLICFETNEEAQRAMADINRYPGRKASLYYSRCKIQENQEKGPSDTNNSAEKKNRKKNQTN